MPRTSWSWPDYARHDTGIVMFASTLVFTVLLLPIALTQKFLRHDARLVVAHRVRCPRR
jgi:hypothetical protein